MKTITILSGKGGAGKSTLTASLSVMLANRNKIVAVDCDADAPNLALVLGLEEEQFDNWESITTGEKVEMNQEKLETLKLHSNYQDLKKCVDVCNFSAITWNQEENIPILNELLCVGCGACQLECPEIFSLKKVENARVGVGKTQYGFPIVSGKLEIGESGSGKVVNAIRTTAANIAEGIQADYMIMDSAAGIGCPVIASLTGSDYVILVTEPTSVAFWDLKRAIELVDHFNIPCGAVINRWGINKDFTYQLQDYFQDKQIPLLGRIPYDLRFIEALINLKPAVIYEPKFKPIFREIMNNCLSDMNSIPL
ncbi:MAG: ATP-binding protein [Euryarchaeota archaeon]|jgi:MinD superfamily P-loop ATPase|uniref:nucleotide-binding protein n=1 Tax=Methanobacterium sp. MZD130B TaxID=3394378 RepID=UPI001774D6CC|nr:ATP-binding protein [Euryarchaeota archaeon]HHT18070.1 P-loop NTPase [Methanobacterium sp.]